MAGERLLGSVEPRLFTPPLRPLNRETSRGFAAIDFARYAGTPFLPWQEWLAVHALETTPDGRYRFRVVLVVVARQNGKSTWKRGITLFRMYLDGARLVAAHLARDEQEPSGRHDHAGGVLEARGDGRLGGRDDGVWSLARGHRGRHRRSRARQA